MKHKMSNPVIKSETVTKAKAVATVRLFEVDDHLCIGVSLTHSQGSVSEDYFVANWKVPAKVRNEIAQKATSIVDELRAALTSHTSPEEMVEGIRQSGWKKARGSFDSLIDTERKIRAIDSEIAGITESMFSQDELQMLAKGSVPPRLQANATAVLRLAEADRL